MSFLSTLSDRMNELPEGKRKAAYAGIFVGIALVCYLLFTTLRTPAYKPDEPEVTKWVCQNPECKNEFTLTARQVMLAHRKGGPPECPKCGKNDTVEVPKP